MSDEVINARLAEYLGRYTTFAMPAGDNATSGARLRARKMWTAPRSAVRGIGGGVLALALVAALVVALGIGFGLRSRTQTAQSVGSTLFSGPPAQPVADARNNFVWFTGTNSLRTTPLPASQGGTEPATGAQPGVTATGMRVVVLDWTGAVRYRFTIGPSSAGSGVPPGSGEHLGRRHPSPSQRRGRAESDRSSRWCNPRSQAFCRYASLDQRWRRSVRRDRGGWATVALPLRLGRDASRDCVGRGQHDGHDRGILR